jgi:nucleoside diphosphate kinase
VIDELFSDFKGRFVFNFMDDLVVYSPSLDQHERHLRRVYQRLQEAGFTLNKDKITVVSSEIRYFGHYLSSRGSRVIPERVEAIRAFPRTPI